MNKHKQELANARKIKEAKRMATQGDIATQRLADLQAETQEKCEPVLMYADGSAVSILGATSMREAMTVIDDVERAERIDELVGVYQSVMSNIVVSPLITDKGTAIERAAMELAEMIRSGKSIVQSGYVEVVGASTTPADDKQGARHSANDGRDLQSVHDLAVKLGAVCGMKVLKDADGNAYWFGWVSNKYRDRDTAKFPRGEIITDAAHKEFVDYLRANPDKMPELWSWHTPGTQRKARADWVDYSDGFLVMSGPLTPDEAKSFGEDEVLGMSHGFHNLTHTLGPKAQEYAKSNGLILKYRTFEVTELPVDHAANAWTAFDVIRKELSMFNPEQRAHLIKRFGEDKVTELERNTEAGGKALDDLGVEWKSITPDVPAETPTPAPVSPTPQDAAHALDELKALLNVDGLNAVITGLQESNKALAVKLDTLTAQIVELKKSDDEKVSEKFAPRNKPVSWGYSPTESTKNVQSPDEAEKSKAAGPSWLQEVFAPVAH